MLTRRLGRTGPTVSAIGLGAMGMSDFYGHADEAESTATIDAALDAGVTLIDTGDFYGMGHNEMLIGTALQNGALKHNSKRDKAILSVKFGAQRGPDGAFMGFAGDAASTKTALAYTLKRLRVDYIDIYRPARVSPLVPIEETVGAIADLVKAGYVRHIGLSEAGAENIRRAHKVHPIVDLQIEYSIMTRSVENEILPVLRELGIGMTAYGVLSRGLISESALGGGSIGGFRSHSPRFQGDNLGKNLTLVQALKVDCRREGLLRGAAGDCLGRTAWRRHRATGRRPQARAPDGIAGRARYRADTGGAGADRCSRACRRGRRHAVCARADGHARL